MSAKILVVDDESGMRRSLGIMLRREGYAVNEASDGPEAADLLGRDVYDLVIADLRMEQLSGIDLLRLVKKNTPDVEVIVMTAFGTIESAVEAMRLGAYDFIAKPFQVEEILLRVGNALERRRLKACCDPRSRMSSPWKASSASATPSGRRSTSCPASPRRTARCSSPARAAPERS